MAFVPADFAKTEVENRRLFMAPNFLRGGAVSILLVSHTIKQNCLRCLLAPYSILSTFFATTWETFHLYLLPAANLHRDVLPYCGTCIAPCSAVWSGGGALP
jgi:hypothetical protein